jgi:hypothetical protein
MSCCGSRRAAYHSVPSSSVPTATASYRPISATEFEYTGHTQLTVRGSATGVVYRFQAHGQRVSVHGADVASLGSIPSLRVVRS